MNYTGLRTQVSNYLNRGDISDAQMDVFIDNAEAELNRMVRHRKMIKRVTANISAHFTTLPADWLEAVNVQLNTDPLTLLRQVTLETADQYRENNGDTTGTPQFYAIVGETLELVPRPSAEVTLELTYYSKIPALSETNTSNWLIEEYPDLYLYAVAKQACIFLMDDERLTTYAALYTAQLNALQDEQERVKFAGGSLTVKRRTYGGGSSRTVYYRTN